MGCAGTPEVYGPVTYVVRNQAGKVEVEATVALDGNQTTTATTGHIDETDDDPIAAADLGTVAALTVNLYNDTGGTLTETRLYHDVPGTSPGSDGTSYDPTLYGYDPLVRRRRTKEASGTIRRTSFDAIGRSIAQYVGTNDSTFDGGEPSGTDDMVKTSEVEYDGGADDGNGSRPTTSGPSAARTVPTLRRTPTSSTGTAAPGRRSIRPAAARRCSTGPARATSSPRPASTAARASSAGTA